MLTQYKGDLYTIWTLNLLFLSFTISYGKDELENNKFLLYIWPQIQLFNLWTGWKFGYVI